jgi:hypothetical protein
LTRRANHRHYSSIADFQAAHGPAKRLFGAIASQNSRQLKFYRLAAGNDCLRVAATRALAMRVPEEKST